MAFLTVAMMALRYYLELSKGFPEAQLGITSIEKVLVDP